MVSFIQKLICDIR